jgi:hypothetical protein
MDVAFNARQNFRTLRAIFMDPVSAVRRHPGTVQSGEKSDGVSRTADKKLLVLELHNR